MEKICQSYGTRLGSLDDDYIYYDFPTPVALAEASVESKLRALGFGYRAPYIYLAAHSIVHERPKGWLLSLRNAPYDVAKEALIELKGVGPKIADCVVLASIHVAE
jgi:N-glycosylase/DNA lyase